MVLIIGQLDRLAGLVGFEHREHEFVGDGCIGEAAVRLDDASHAAHEVVGLGLERVMGDVRRVRANAGEFNPAGVAGLGWRIELVVADRALITKDPDRKRIRLDAFEVDRDLAEHAVGEADKRDFEAVVFERGAVVPTAF